MTFNRSLLPLAFLSVGLPAAWAVNVKTDQSSTALLSHYSTFAWKGDASDGQGHSLLAERVHEAFNHQLEGKGWHQTAEHPDVYLVYRMIERPRTERNYVAGGWYSPGFRRWPSAYYNAPSFYTSHFVQGQLSLEMVDAKTKNVIWRMVGDDTGSDSIDVEHQKQIERMAQKAFHDFPVTEQK